MYRIMLVTKDDANANNKNYKFMTVKNDRGQSTIFEVETLDELDEKVEEMLNGNYAKKDFIVVQVLDYNINADIA